MVVTLIKSMSGDLTLEKSIVAPLTDLAEFLGNFMVSYET